MADYDVIVVGAGNAALAAAVSARQQGAGRVAVLEKAPRELRGGNTHYSGGLFRFAYDSAEDLRPLVPDAEQEVPGFFASVEPYPQKRFWEDLLRVTESRTDPELAEILIGRSYDTLRWVAEQGVRLEPAVSLSAVKVGGVIKWSPGAVIRAQHEGVGLSASWFKIAAARGVDITYDTGALGLLQDRRGRVTGVLAQDPEGTREITAGSVVLACGGFEANPEWRARYLGRPWDHAKVRGTRYNMGDGLRMAVEIGALVHGQWTGCHSTPIDADAPPHGDRKLTDKTNRLSYPYGVLVNARGRRFFDEGEDFQFYTYAKLGGIILNEPSGVGYQIFDQKVVRPSRGTLQDGPADHRRHAGRPGRAAARRPGGVSRDARALQCRREAGRLRRDGQGRAPDERARPAQVQLGAAARLPAVRGLSRDRRHHVHLRRGARELAGAGPEHPVAAHPGALRLRRDGGRPLPHQLPRRQRAHVGRRVRADRRRRRGRPIAATNRGTR